MSGEIELAAIKKNPGKAGTLSRTLTDKLRDQTRLVTI